MTSEEIPRVFYQGKCRTMFIVKRELVALKRKAATNPSDDAIQTCSNKRQSRAIKK